MEVLECFLVTVNAQKFASESDFVPSWKNFSSVSDFLRFHTWGNSGIEPFSVDRDVMVVAVAPLLGPPVHEPHPDRRVARREVLQVFVDQRGGLGRQGCSPSWHNAYTT